MYIGHTLSHCYSHNWYQAGARRMAHVPLQGMYTWEGGCGRIELTEAAFAAPLGAATLRRLDRRVGRGHRGGEQLLEVGGAEAGGGVPAGGGGVAIRRREGPRPSALVPSVTS